MPRVTGLGHVGIYVRDLERMVAFYRDVMGMRITKQNWRVGIVFLSADPDAVDHEIALMRGRPDATDPHLIQQISMRVASLDDLRAFHRRLVADGYRIEEVVNHASAIGCYFFDPEGNRTEVFWVTGRPCWVPPSAPSTSISPTTRCSPRWTASSHSSATSRWEDGCRRKARRSRRRPGRARNGEHHGTATHSSDVPGQRRARRASRAGLRPGQAGPYGATHREDRAAGHGGIQMEQGTIRFLKDRNYTLAGRKVELVVGDTGGNPRAPRPRRRSWSSATTST